MCCFDPAVWGAVGRVGAQLPGGVQAEGEGKIRVTDVTCSEGRRSIYSYRAWSVSHPTVIQKLPLSVSISQDSNGCVNENQRGDLNQKPDEEVTKNNTK